LDRFAILSLMSPGNLTEEYIKIVIVGGGMQAWLIAKNLQERKEKPEVTIADIVEPSEPPAGVQFLQSRIS
jgi:hypothetical protein